MTIDERPEVTALRTEADALQARITAAVAADDDDLVARLWSQKHAIMLRIHEGELAHEAALCAGADGQAIIRIQKANQALRWAVFVMRQARNELESAVAAARKRDA